MASLSKNARIAGALYILFSLFGIVRLVYIPNTLFASSDPATRANAILAHELLFRFGIVSELISAAGWLFVTLALYRLLKGVNQGVAVLMVILGSLMVTPLFFMNSVNDGAALLFARGGDFLSVFDKPQRDAFVMLFLRLHHYLDLANEIFWGLWLLPLGFLVYKSRFLPRLLGIWLMIACFAYLAMSVTGFMWPQYEDKLWNMMSPITAGELLFAFWLVIMGAKERTQAATRL